MEVVATKIPDVKVIKPVKYFDRRGFFSETYNKRAFAEAGIGLEFVQDNHSFSAQKNVVRGLHYQTKPFAQDKLLRVVRGAVFDVAVDLRRGSPTFGRHIGLVLSGDDWNQVLIPQGFAHGFCTLQPKTVVLYKADQVYAPSHDGGVYWADPALAIKWPVTPSEAQISPKDQILPALNQLACVFE